MWRATAVVYLWKMEEDVVRRYFLAKSNGDAVTGIRVQGLFSSLADVRASEPSRTIDVDNRFQEQVAPSRPSSAFDVAAQGVSRAIRVLQVGRTSVTAFIYHHQVNGGGGGAGIGEGAPA